MIVMRTKSMTAVAMALGLAACAGGPSRVATTPPPPAGPAVSDTDAAFDAMLAGNTAAAAKRLRAVLKREPGNATALLLKDSLDNDAKATLGPSSYPYTVRSGDTITSLAQRLLGNRLKAYQLLRYNDLKAPVTLTPGQVLRIPGEPPHIEPIRRPEPTPVRPAPAGPAPTPKPKPAAPAAPAANPAAARQARAAGLTALNQGNVDRAVGLLRRAAALDPANPLVARDLARAERIAATVRARK